FFERAVVLDPNFAMAHARLAVNYFNSDDTVRATESARKAYELRQRVSERERFYIESTYEVNVTENLEAARKLYETWAQTYPRDDVPPNDLGVIYAILGENEKSLSAYQETMQLDPGNAISYGNLIHTYIGLNRLDEAKATIEHAKAQHLDFPNLNISLYHIAFLEQDAAGMAREAASLKGKPGIEDVMVYLESETAAYGGQLSRARDLAKGAVDDMQRLGAKEPAAGFQSEAALREALIGNFALAKREAEDALHLAGGNNKYIEALCGIVLA